MENLPPRDPLARERARRRRAEQVRRRRLVLGVCVLALIILIIGLVVGLSGGGKTPTSTSSTQSTGTTGSTQSSQSGGSTSTEAGTGTTTYAADLTGADSVPPVQTEATGTLTLTYDSDAGALSFVLDINGLTKPTVAAIYEGAAGNPGTAVLNLFNGPAKSGIFSGELAKGSVKASDLTGSLNGKKLSDLIALIKTGNAYVSVGNTSHPIDAIRGQIQ